MEVPNLEIPNSSPPLTPSKNNVSLLLVATIVITILLTASASYILGVNSQKNKVRSSLPTPLTISNSGSTNFVGWDLNISGDGSGKLQYRNVNISNSFPDGTFSNIVDLVTRVGDVSKIHTAYDCAKSVSFGTSTVVTYKGQMSGDIQCLQQNAPNIEKQLQKYVESLQIKSVSKPLNTGPTATHNEICDSIKKNNSKLIDCTGGKACPNGMTCEKAGCPVDDAYMNCPCTLPSYVCRKSF